MSLVGCAGAGRTTSEAPTSGDEDIVESILEAGETLVSSSPSLVPGGVYEGHNSGIVAMVELDSGLVASTARGGEIHLWDPADPSTTIGRFLSHGQVSVSAMATLPDGRVVSGDQWGIVHVWEPGKLPVKSATYERHESLITALTSLADGRVVSADQDGQMHVWDPDAPGESAGIYFAGGDAPTTSLFALADGRVFASVGGDAHLWDPDTPQSGGLKYTNINIWLAFLLDDGSILSSGIDTNGDFNYEIQVRDPADPRNILASVSDFDTGPDSFAQLDDGTIIIGVPTPWRAYRWNPNDPEPPTIVQSQFGGDVAPLLALENGLVASSAPQGFGIALWDPSPN